MTDQQRITEITEHADNFIGGGTEQDWAADIYFLLAEIDRLTEAQRWIPVSERLPDKDVLVLLFLESGNQTKITTSPDFLHKETITHWMPLPAAPDTGNPDSKGE